MKREITNKEKVLKALEGIKYKKARFVKVMCCPECGFNRGIELDGGEDMPNRNDFIFKQDSEGESYIECPCGCRFKLEGGKKLF